MVFLHHPPFPMAPQHPKGNLKSKIITAASQLPSSSDPGFWDEMGHIKW